MEMPENRLKTARERAGFRSASEAASRFGWAVPTYLAHENGSRGIRTAQAIKYGRAFKVSAAWLLTGVDGSKGKLESNEAGNNEISSLALTGRWPRDLPVLGAAQGGERGLFVDNGSFFEMVGRPPNLIDVKDAYAVYMVGHSMEPKFRAGDMLFVHPHKPARSGDYVVVQIDPDSSEKDPEYLVKQFVRRSTNKMTLRQFNPEKELIFSATHIKAVHRIVASSEAD